MLFRAGQITRRLCLILLGTLAPLVSASIPAHGQTSESKLRSQREELERIKRERAELQQKMQGLQTKAHDIREEVDNIDKQRDATRRVVKSLDNQLNSLQGEVVATTESLHEAEQEAVDRRAALDRRLVEIYKRGPLYSAEVLLSAESFGALVARYKYLHLLTLHDKGLVHRVEELRERIAERRAQLVRLAGDVRENRGEKQQEEQRLSDLEQHRQQTLVQVQKEASRAKARLDSLAKTESRLNNLIASLEALRKRETSRTGATARTTSTVKTSDIGKLDWPVEGTIIYPFGRVVNSNNTTTRWNGIGIAAPIGSPVKAVAAGHVVFASEVGTYGKTIIIEHGGGDYSVYGSLKDFSVAKGAAVTKGQVIGSVGKVDPELDAHLHFEIRHDGPAVDPALWLKRH